MDEKERQRRLAKDRKRKLEKRIKAEILSFKGDTTFLPDEYRRLRLSGMRKKDIDKDYDLCHIWR